MTHPAPPPLPVIGTQLPPERTQAVIEAFRSWSAQTGARLLDLDSLLTSLPAADHQDHTLAFVLWQATDAAITESRESTGGSADQRLAALRRPVVGTDGSPLARDVVEAGTIISALIDSTQNRLDHHEGTLAATAGVSADLALAAPLTKSLSMSVSAHRRLLDRSVDPAVTADPAALAQLVRDAAALRAELEAADRERTTLLSEHALDQQRIDALAVLETEARRMAARAAEKISSLPPRGIVAVDQLGPAPDLASLQDSPWPAVRNVLMARSTSLTRAEASLRQVIQTCTAALAERNELRQIVDAFRAKAMAARIGELADVNAAYQTARALLWTAPTDLGAARAAVTAYQQIISAQIVSAQTHPAVPQPPSTNTPLQSSARSDRPTPEVSR